jgi:hypothetical protein
MEQIKQALLRCKLVHPDETGIHLGKKLHWLHNVSTCFLTYLAWHPKRCIGCWLPSTKWHTLGEVVGQAVSQRRFVIDG